MADAKKSRWLIAFGVKFRFPDLTICAWAGHGGIWGSRATLAAWGVDMGWGLGSWGGGGRTKSV